MRILVLGGTQFVGRHVIETLLRAGHQVSVLNRGTSRDEFSTQVERLRGDRDQGPAGLNALEGRVWDVCVDVSGYTAPQVRSSAEMLRERVGHYVFISAVSVYGDPPFGPVDESQPRREPADESVVEVNRETYGPLKVTCENIVREVFSERCALLRPQVVAGPYDPLDRFSYWVRRATQGGEMLAPGDGSDFLQYIDASDLARFTRIICEDGIGGSYNIAGPRLTWSEFMTVLGAQNIVWVSRDVIATAGVTEFELPLYRPTAGPRSSLMHVNNVRAAEIGLTLTSPAITVENVRKWIHGAEQIPALSTEREAELIRLSRM